MIGGVVCIAAAIAGATSQDLKTGYLVGATPVRQQYALLIGVTVSTLAIGATLNLIAILANNGVMPASRSALRTAGRLTSSTEFLNSAAVPHPHLLFLGDILAVPHAVPLANVYSIGDLCIAMGVAIAVHGLAGSRLVPRQCRAAPEVSSRGSGPVVPVS